MSLVLFVWWLSVLVICLAGTNLVTLVFIGCGVGGCIVVWRFFCACAVLDLRWQHDGLSMIAQVTTSIY